MARQLKLTTIKSYSLSQVVNHAENYMIKHDLISFRFTNCNHQNVMIFEYDAADNAYHFIGTYDKTDFVNEVLSSIYRAAN